MTSADELKAQIALRLVAAPIGEVDNAVDDVLAMIGEHTHADRIYLTQFHRDDTIEVQHEWLDSHLVPHRVALGVAEAARFPYSVGLARAGQRCETSDVASLPAAARNEQKSFAAFGVKAILQVPVVYDGDVVGVLGFNSQTERDWSELDDTFVEWVTQVLGIALARKTAATEVADAIADADAARRSARNLLGRFSHELRTPLHVILGYTELLQLKATDPDDADALAHIDFNGRRLLALIDDLLRFGDDDGEGVSFVRLSDVLADVLDAISRVASTNEMTIDIDVDDDLELWFERGRLRQVLYCQLAATVQNSPSGTHVSYTTAERADRTDRAELIMRVNSPLGESLPTIAMPLADALLEDAAELIVERESDEEWTTRFELPTAPPD